MPRKNTVNFTARLARLRIFQKPVRRTPQVQEESGLCR